MHTFDLDTPPDDSGLPACQIALHSLPMGITMMVRDDGFLHRPPNHILPFAAENAFRRRVKLDDAAVAIRYDDAIKRRCEKRLGQMRPVEGPVICHCRVGVGLGHRGTSLRKHAVYADRMFPLQLTSASCSFQLFQTAAPSERGQQR